MNRYAQGGMPDIARHVQAQGRGDDKILVHMTPQEVGGLQALAMRHGGSLTINPNTGLVEAGFLSRLLPMIAGAALSATGVGAPMAALMVGGATGLATGSLKKGLMAGFGAFGGAGLGSALSAAGQASATAGQVMTPELAQAAAVAPPPVPTGFNPGVDFSIQTPPPVPPAGPATAFEFGSPAPAAAVPPPTFSQNLANMGKGASNILGGGTPEQAAAARSAFMTDVGGVRGLATKGAAALTSTVGEEEPYSPPTQQAYIRRYKYDPGRQDVTYRTGERGESTAEQSYFRPTYTPMGIYKVGEEPPFSGGGDVREKMKRRPKLYTPADLRDSNALEEKALELFAEGGNVGFDKDLNMNVGGISAYSDEFYGGGLTALSAGGAPSKPRFLVGKGDGMSDSIPATINDTQPARLADGEFVVPADVVSHLGNGSSKAGAAKLHAMMNRIRKARTGKKRQAPEVRAERYMPA